MRLSTKFVLLVAGTIAIPFLVAGLIVLVHFKEAPDRLSLFQHVKLLRTLRHLEIRGGDPGRAAALLREAAPGAEALILDAEGRPVYRAGPEPPSVFPPAAGTGPLYSYLRARMTAPDGVVYSVLVGSPVVGEPGSARWYLVLIVPVSVLGFMTLMSILIIRSINASIARLEAATRRISEGDLDFELRAAGNDRIASLTRSFDVMRERVREETAARSRFILAVSHDLKTPLSSIVGYLDAIRDGLATSPQKLEEYLAIIRDKTGLLEGRIRQLIDFVKLETGEWKRSREDTPLAPFLEEAATAFGREAEARGFGFQARIELDAGLAVPMDGDLVYRALENLVHNAFRYAEPGSAIRFLAGREDGGIALSIRNRGEAIAASDLPFIFEPFYRGSRSRRESGFGLGLSVVKSVVSSHGWAIEAGSAGGETRFTVRIPAG